MAPHFYGYIISKNPQLLHFDALHQNVYTAAAAAAGICRICLIVNLTILNFLRREVCAYVKERVLDVYDWLKRQCYGLLAYTIL